MTPSPDPPSRASAEIQSSTIPPHLIPLFLKNKLRPLLPHTLPLYRRCQFFLHDLHTKPPNHQHPSNPTALGEPELWIAVAITNPPPPTPSDPDKPSWLTTWLSDQQPPPSASSQPPPWLSAHIDIREPGQTQIWLTGSWEPNAQTSALGPTRTQLTLGEALHHRIRTHHTPSLPVTPTRQFSAMLAEGKKMTVPYARGRVTFGTVAEASWWVLGDGVVRAHLPSTDLATGTAMVRADKSYLKYILPLPLPESPAPTPSAAGVEDVHVGELTKAHLQTMLDRSTIPRSLETLTALPSRGLFVTGSPDPIAWGVVTKDASVGSLHTEDGYRGKRLAERVVRELVQVQGRVFRSEFDDEWEEGAGGDGVVDVEVPWTHTDVSFDNLASRRVFERMGARVGWRVGWFEVMVGDS